MKKFSLTLAVIFFITAIVLYHIIGVLHPVVSGDLAVAQLENSDEGYLIATQAYKWLYLAPLVSAVMSFVFAWKAFFSPKKKTETKP